MHVDLTVQTVLYLIALVLFIAAAVMITRERQLLAAGLAVFALAHVVH
jgi:hypothetical protein